jgi:hypothetical protein
MRVSRRPPQPPHLQLHSVRLCPARRRRRHVDRQPQHPLLPAQGKGCHPAPISHVTYAHAHAADETVLVAQSPQNHCANCDKM